jgi:hypothetical protein
VRASTAADSSRKLACSYQKLAFLPYLYAGGYRSTEEVPYGDKPVIAFAPNDLGPAGDQGIEINSTFYWLPLRLCCAFGRAAAGWHIPVRIENDRPMRSTVVGNVFVEPHHYQTRPTVRTPLIVVSGSHGVLRTAQSQQIQRPSSARRPQRGLTRAALPSRQCHDATCARIRLLAGSHSLERSGLSNDSMSSKLETADIAERSAPGGGTRGSPRRDARAASA